MSNDTGKQHKATDYLVQTIQIILATQGVMLSIILTSPEVAITSKTKLAVGFFGGSILLGIITLLYIISFDINNLDDRDPIAHYNLVRFFFGATWIGFLIGIGFLGCHLFQG